MKSANPFSLTKSSEIDKSQLTNINRQVLKEIVRTEINPTPAEVRLENWRFKKLRIANQTS